jgi:crossover junction endodeoxyribonuclease RuvC
MKLSNASRATAAESRSASRRIIGIDPGLANSGWGIVDASSNKMKYIAHGCIETKAGCPRAERLFLIYTAIREVVREYSPQEAAIETLYFAKNVTSAITVAEARGVLSVAMAEAGIFVREFTPLEIKQAVVGGGRAEKKQVQEMVRLILGLQEIPKPDHAADALAAAVCAANTVIIGREQ